jgi:hypothetical protein
MNRLLTITTLFLLLLLSSGCANRHGISLKYYSECKEYYDLQGYYHKECGDDDLITYEEMGKLIKKKKVESHDNVW